MAQAPVRTQSGFHVVKLDKKRPAQLFPDYESQKPQLINVLTNKKVSEHVAALIKDAKIQ